MYNLSAHTHIWGKEKSDNFITSGFSVQTIWNNSLNNISCHSNKGLDSGKPIEDEYVHSSIVLVIVYQNPFVGGIENWPWRHSQGDITS